MALLLRITISQSVTTTPVVVFFFFSMVRILGHGPENCRPGMRHGADILDQTQHHGLPVVLRDLDPESFQVGWFVSERPSCYEKKSQVTSLKNRL